MKVSLSIPDKLVAEVDELRSDVSRSRFVTRAIEGYLKEDLAQIVRREAPLANLTSADPGGIPHRQIPTGHGVRRVRSDG